MDDVQVVQLKDLGIAKAVEATDDVVLPILAKIFPEPTNSFEFAIDNMCSESASFSTTMDDVLVGQLKDLGIAKAVEANDDILWLILTKTFPESANSTEFASGSICSESALCICVCIWNETSAK